MTTKTHPGQNEDTQYNYMCMGGEQYHAIHDIGLLTTCVYIGGACGEIVNPFPLPSKHGAFTQCCFNVGTASKTVCQHWNSLGWMSRVCWVSYRPYIFTHLKVDSYLIKLRPIIYRYHCSNTHFISNNSDACCCWSKWFITIIVALSA